MWGGRRILGQRNRNSFIVVPLGGDKEPSQEGCGRWPAVIKVMREE